MPQEFFLSGAPQVPPALADLHPSALLPESALPAIGVAVLAVGASALAVSPAARRLRAALRVAGVPARPARLDTLSLGSGGIAPDPRSEDPRRRPTPLVSGSAGSASGPR
jgi:hypothetical protein